MQPTNNFNYDELIQQWYKAAMDNETNTSKKMELYNDTEKAVEQLEKMGKQAEDFADIILQTFERHGMEKSKILAKWIAKNTGITGRGAYPILHRLFQTIANIKGYQNALTSNIDSAGLRYGEMGKNIPFRVECNDVMDQIIGDFVRSNQPEDTVALEKTSKQIRKKVIETYRIPLKSLNIKTASEVISFVKKYGEKLTYIDISNIEFSKIEIEEFVKYLPNLNTLLARHCKLEKEGAKAIAEKLLKLTALDLCVNQIGGDGAKAIAEKLLKLTALELCGNHIGDDGAKAIAEKLLNLTALNLRHNHIGDDGAKAIAEKLLKLTVLSLSVNDIGDDGAKAIAEKLLNLTTLDLSENQIGDDGAKAIAEKLLNLTALYLGGNDIGDDGAKAIAEKLLNLTTLDLCYNHFGDDGAKAIAEKLLNLTELDLADNGIGAEGAKAIAEKLLNLTVLNLRHNHIGDDGAKAIEAFKLLTNCKVMF